MEVFKEERREMVRQWQKEYNMIPRNDSKLTEMFANGETGGMTAQEIARELVATDFIYKHTLYGETIEEFLRQVASRVKEEHNLSWTSTWNIVRFYGPIALKLICLLQTNTCIPNRLP